MMQLQKQLFEFNDKIRLDYDNNKELREKRNVILNKLRNSRQLPSFDYFNQGSYAMYTGVKPIDTDKEYDIDVGIIFHISIDEYNPLTLKTLVRDRLKLHTEYGAEIKRPCVTVTYKKKGERAYHVDLAIYAYEDKNNPDSQLYLAKGKSKNSDDVGWEKSDPKGLKDYIGDINEENKRMQFQRLVRYVKIWKNLKFSPNGHAEPPSIGLTLMMHDFHQYVANDDLKSMSSTIGKILQQFKFSSWAEDGSCLYRLHYSMPEQLRFENDTDIFGKMTDLQMTTFKDKLETYNKKLLEVIKEKEPVVQCQMLSSLYGTDFPLIESTDAYQEQKSYIPYSSSSGV